MSRPLDTHRRPPPIHPGEFLREDYLPELGFTPEEFARELGVAPSIVSDLISEERPLSPELAYRLSLYFQTSPEFWVNLQTAFELNTIYHSSLDQIRREVHPRLAA